MGYREFRDAHGETWGGGTIEKKSEQDTMKKAKKIDPPKNRALGSLLPPDYAAQQALERAVEKLKAPLLRSALAVLELDRTEKALDKVERRLVERDFDKPRDVERAKAAMIAARNEHARAVTRSDAAFDAAVRIAQQGIREDARRHRAAKAVRTKRA